MLKIRFTDNRQPPFWAVEKTFSIGRAQSNHLCIDEASVDLTHARIINRGETYLLKDAGTETGTFVNGTRITQRNVGCGDRIQIGNTSIEIIDPLAEQHKSNTWALIANSSWLSGHEFPVNAYEENDKVLIGRATHCDIVIPGTHLSREHAEIVLDGEQLLIRDLGSVNGTYVNDQKISASKLVAGDQIRVDVYSFKVFGPGIQLPQAATQTMPAVKAEDAKAKTGNEQKLWKTRATSPGNRTQENLYKYNWVPTAVAIALLVAFLAGIAYLFIT